MWLIDTEKNLAMCCLPKNGSHSLREHFDTRTVDNSQVLAVPTRVVWLRNTKIRLVSNYSFFKKHNEKGSYKGRPTPRETSSWEAFVDFILEHDGVHWGCQVDQLTHDGIYLGTVTHKFEDINTIWGNYYPGFIPHTNGCTHEVVFDYRQDEIDAKYARDDEIWSGLP